MASTNDVSPADSVLNDLLARTSRTFALAIPFLPYPVRREVTIAYLLFRVADTIEDGTHLSRHEKLAGLDALDRSLEMNSNQGILAMNSNQGEVRADLALPRPPLENADYLELLDELPVVLAAVDKLQQESRSAIIGSLKASVSGMRHYIGAGSDDGNLRIASFDQLREYCYYVAGVVGEMLTDLFICGATWLDDFRPQLMANARWFGEGLQLVNVLKDADDDRRAGRAIIPQGADLAALFDLARDDLEKAECYASDLERAEAPPGIVAFTRLPLQLAFRTLECVAQTGPGSKVPREEVNQLVAAAIASLSSRSRSAEVHVR